MAVKRKIQTQKDYIRVGMAFFLVGMIMNMVVDGRLIGALFTSLISNQVLMDKLQSMAAGFSIPILCASIYYNLRSLSMSRSL